VRENCKSYAVVFENISPLISIKRNGSNSKNTIEGEIKMKRSLSHMLWECKYHIVWVPKNRKKFKDMDGEQIKITRDPEFTKTGRAATSMNWDNYKIFLELL